MLRPASSRQHPAAGLSPNLPNFYIIKPLHELKTALKSDIILTEKTEKALSEYRKGSDTQKEKMLFLMN
jgi:hypothetical protein